MIELNAWTVLFLAALSCGLALQAWLTRRNVAHISSQRERVPEAFRGQIPLQAHRKAADYTIARDRFALAHRGYRALLLLGWTLGGALALLDQAWRASEAPDLARGLGVIISALLLTALFELPFAAWRTFVLEQRFGFNRATPAVFAADTFKKAGLFLALALPLGALALWLMKVAGPLWWLSLWVLWTAFALLTMWAYPALIAPLFNRFTPLEDPALEARIWRLSASRDLPLTDILVMDGSRRSARGNAYFAGLGTSRRVVLLDTLLGQLEPPEIEAVLAHELGHLKRRHLQKFLLANALVSLAGLALLGWAAERAWFYGGLGVGDPAPHMALVLFLLIAPVFAVFVRPIISRLSSGFEFEADAFAAESSDARALIRALTKLHRENAVALVADPLYSAFYHSHPLLPDRVARLQVQTP